MKFLLLPALAGFTCQLPAADLLSYNFDDALPAYRYGYGYQETGSSANDNGIYVPGAGAGGTTGLVSTFDTNNMSGGYAGFGTGFGGGDALGGFAEISSLTTLQGLSYTLDLSAAGLSGTAAVVQMEIKFEAPDNTIQPPDADTGTDVMLRLQLNVEINATFETFTSPLSEWTIAAGSLADLRTYLSSLNNINFNINYGSGSNLPAFGNDSGNQIKADNYRLFTSLPSTPFSTPVFPAGGQYINDFSVKLAAEWKALGWRRLGVLSNAGQAQITTNINTGAGVGGGGAVSNWPYNNENPAPFTLILPLAPVKAPVSFLGAGENGNLFADSWLINSGNNPAHAAKTTLTLRGLPTHTSLSLGFLMGIGVSIDGDDRVPASGQVFTIRLNNGPAGEMQDVFGLGNGEGDAANVTGAITLFRNANAHPFYREQWLPGPQTAADRASLNWTVASAFDLSVTAPLSDIPHTASTLSLELLHGLSQDNNDEVIALDNFRLILGGLVPGINAGQWAASYLNDADQAALTGPAWNGDLDQDGISNLLEYALNSDPVNATPASFLPTSSIVQSGGQSYLAISYRSPKGALARNDLTRLVEASSNLAGTPWAAVSTVPFGAAVDNGGGTETITLRDTQPAPQTGTLRRFLRLRFTLMQ